MNGADISWSALAVGGLVMSIPIGILYYYKTGLVKDVLWAFGRMSIQLILVGLYLKYIFDLDYLWLNLLWVCVMIIAAALVVLKRSNLNFKYFFIPILNSILFSTLTNGVVFAFLIIGADRFFSARFIIPIAGMMIGNCLGSAIIGIRTFYNTILEEEEKYKYILMLGADKNEALQPFTAKAMKEAFAPVIANTSSIGLIWLPGMMTGQILGGSDPGTAVKYQIMIIIGIFISSVLTVFLSIKGSKTLAFDEYGMIKRDIIKTHHTI